MVKVKHTVAERALNLDFLPIQNCCLIIPDDEKAVSLIVIIVIFIISIDLYASLSLPRLAFGSRNSGGGDLTS